MYLHKEAGSGSKKQFSEASSKACPHFVGITFMRISDPIFGEISDTEREKPLTSFTAISHDEKKKVRVTVRGENEPFPETKSVLKDNAEIA